MSRSSTELASRQISVRSAAVISKNARKWLKREKVVEKTRDAPRPLRVVSKHHLDRSHHEPQPDASEFRVHNRGVMLSDRPRHHRAVFGCALTCHGFSHLSQTKSSSIS